MTEDPNISSLRPLLRKIAENEHLTRSEAAGAMQLMLEGACLPEEIAGFLLGLRSRSESLDELIGLTEAMRNQCIPVRLEDQSAVDIVGTGGDGSGTFNISTTAALVCSGAGAVVAKHGNRSVSSKCGSSDVLEALGVFTEMDSLRIEDCLGRFGIAFMFAPLFHTALRHVMPVRRSLGVRTFFNILGPLCNPAGVRRHFVGAFSEHVAEQMAHILSETGSTHVVVAHSEDGMDEISISAPTRLFLKLGNDTAIRTQLVEPEMFGFQRARLSEIQGGDARENAGIIRAILGGENGAPRDVVVLNAGVALVAAGAADSFEIGIEMATSSIDSGQALEKLNQLARYSEQIRADEESN